MRIDLTPRQVENFWKKVDQSGGPDGCWPWLASFGTGGYGKFGVGTQQTEGAHRVAYLLAHGDIPDDLPCILHRCDNRPCVNPAHLFAGTKRDNTHDMFTKGRAGQQTGKWRPILGSASPNSKLTEEDVLVIRLAITNGTHTKAELAADYCVSEASIHKIHYRQSWKHV
jgi:hypothetical protein